MMYCPNCGHEMKDGETFCTNCGSKIENGKAVYTNFNSSSAKMEETNKDNGLISMVCGILSLIIPYFNIVLSIIAIHFAKQTKPENTYSKAGHITGIIGLVLSIVTIVCSLIFFIYLLTVGIIAGSQSLTY